MSRPLEFPASFVTPWRNLLLSHQNERSRDAPNYHDAGAIDSLLTTSAPRLLYVGTGHSIFTRAILPAIASARHSIHFVTCYWAASPSLDGIRQSLLQLAESRAGPGEPLPTIHVSVGFSSWGLLQKLFHTSAPEGCTYPPSRWAKLGLPDEETLRKGGIEMTVKSLFFTPLSVMHPKYVVVDEAKAWVPSCNVSWERWFEGCVELEGDVVDRLLAFHARVWGARVDGARPAINGGIELARRERVAADGPPSGHVDEGADEDVRDETSSSSPLNREDDNRSATRCIHFAALAPTPTIFLPSPHHRNPRFKFFPFFSQSDPPMTPLNAALLTLFANARHDIHLVTPNLTSWPVLDALLEALSRGVHVQLRTGRNMMVIEQLVTAGTTTSWCLRRFRKKYQALCKRSKRSGLEAQPVSPGQLEIFYYKRLGDGANLEDEPVSSHFKMTMVDGEYLVLGSGNMDRASWWTSQEIGVLFYMPGFRERRAWESVLEERAELVFRSAD
ncbi:phospholipase d transphosphatidylase [Trichoderma cornu-damae]|uniref:Phospholipase d transphosphatidylase n=1 Tax=Trichoderma cornu-damae TaxID=654480 RepID=A0A9P8QDP0_9HYPO|nr:phospholipase d transphosphatidylase [Trichoderma cornu-damae]